MNQRNPSAVVRALRTLKREILDFDFDYPFETDIAAGPRDSLHYYVYSDGLSWETMRMDSNGVPKAWSRTTGPQYWPNFIAWYGLIQLGHFLRGKGAHHLDNFLKQIDWLESHAVVRNGAVVWTMDFDYAEHEIPLRAPWISAYAQGLAISALVRGWRMTRRPHLFALLQRSGEIFDLDVSQGGIRALVNGSTFYTEVPGGRVPGILDGFLTSILGLYDLYTETEDPRVKRSLSAGIEGLKALLPWWDYQKKWSWYGHQDYLCPPAYHFQNRVLLGVIARLSGEACFKECAERWNPANFSAIE